MPKFFAPFKIPALIGSAALLLGALPAGAADNHTYRNGQTYASIAAANAQMCEMSCAGDAQCRGWNFLRSGARDGSGMCEFNATHANPSAHPFAISGTNSGNIYSSSQVVPGDTRTFRIGNPRDAIVPSTVPKRRPVEKPVIRKRVFAPVQAGPAAAAPQPARHGQPQMQIRPRPQSVPAQARAPQRPRAPHPNMQGNMHPNAPQTRPANFQRPAQITGASRRIDPRFAPQAPHRPQPAQRLQSAQRPQPAQHSQPGLNQQRLAPQTRAPQRPPQAAPQFAPQRPQPPQAAPAHQAQGLMPPKSAAPSLYGSLYDAPQKRPSAPIAAPATPASPTPPLYSQRPADDPDAPVTTSAAVPSIPVSRAPLPAAPQAPSQARAQVQAQVQAQASGPQSPRAGWPQR